MKDFKKVLQAVFVAIICIGVMSTAFLLTFAIEDETSSDVSSDGEILSSSVSSSSPDSSDIQSDVSSDESQVSSEDTSTESSKVSSGSSDGDQNESNTSSQSQTSSSSSTVNHATTSIVHGNDAGTGGKYSTFIDESTGGEVIANEEADEEITEDESDFDHFIDKNVTALRSTILRIIWIPILFILLAAAALVYVNIIYPKKMGMQQDLEKEKALKKQKNKSTAAKRRKR